MDKKAYQEAIRYASRFDFQLRKDLVHDAYLAYHKSKKENLFDQYRGVVTKTVKNVCLSQLSTSQRFMWRGKKYKKNHISIDSDYVEDSSGYVASTTETPLDVLLLKDGEEFIERKLSKKHLEAYKLLMEGATLKELEETTGSSRQLVCSRVNKIKEAFKQWN